VRCFLRPANEVKFIADVIAMYRSIERFFSHEDIPRGWRVAA
jgi:hypothetical protein